VSKKEKYKQEKKDESYKKQREATDKVNKYINKKHLKNVGPIRYCEPPLHCQSPGVSSCTPAIAIAQAACDVHDNNNNKNDNA